MSARAANKKVDLFEQYPGLTLAQSSMARAIAAVENGNFAATPTPAQRDLARKLDMAGYVLEAKPVMRDLF